VRAARRSLWPGQRRSARAIGSMELMPSGRWTTASSCRKLKPRDLGASQSSRSRNPAAGKNVRAARLVTQRLVGNSSAAVKMRSDKDEQWSG
jgi:hypothetical protein